MPDEHFHTFGEYMKKGSESLTAAMEDYLEMIYRLARETGFTRVHLLAAALNVQPPSVTRMLQKLAKHNLISYERYGMIVLQRAGQELGEALLKRHNTVEAFLALLGVAEAVRLEETEKIEHTITPHTVQRFGEFISFVREEYPELGAAFRAYTARKR